jgi:hypothetical protein
MGEWMVGAIHMDDLRDQIEDNIDLLGKLKDTDNSIAKINNGLSRLFNNLSTKDIIVKEGITNELDKLFDELNKTGFMRARKLGLVYNPYKIRFRKNKRKVNIMKAELATKTVTPHISRELRTDAGERPTASIALRSMSIEREDARMTAYKSYIEDSAHRLFLHVNGLTKAVLGTALTEPKYVFVDKASKSEHHQAFYDAKKNEVVFYTDSVLPKYDSLVAEKNPKTQLAYTVSMYRLIGHELSHALLEKARNEHEVSPAYRDQLSWKQISEGLAEFIGAYVAILEYGSKATPQKAAITTLAFVSAESYYTAEAINITKKSLAEGQPNAGNLSAFVREMQTLDEVFFSSEIFYTLPKLALARAMISSKPDSFEEFIIAVLKEPDKFSSIAELFSSNGYTKVIGRITEQTLGSLNDVLVEEDRLSEQAIMARRPTIKESFLSIFSRKPPQAPIDYAKIYSEAKATVEFRRTMETADRMALTARNISEQADGMIKELSST